MLRIEKKTSAHPILQRIISVVAALVVAGVVIAICGYNPFVVYKNMLLGSFGSAYYVKQTIQKVIPLLVMGLGVAVCFKMNFINIGADGQFYAGAIAATYVALHSDGMPAWVAMMLMFIVAFAAGGVWCLIAGVLNDEQVGESALKLALGALDRNMRSINRHSDPSGNLDRMLTNSRHCLLLSKFRGRYQM